MKVLCPTEKLLLGISSRLSGREDCRSINYKVTISTSGVVMWPIIYVFPNQHNRKESDKVDVVSYVHTNILPDARLDSFILGTYEYQSSYDNKRRRWVKVS